MTNDTLLHLFADSLRALEELMDDVPDARLAEQPAGLTNHPAWTLTHLCTAHDFTLQCVNRQPICPPDWQTIAGTGTQPRADRSAYPTKAELLDTLRRQHDHIADGVRAASSDHFEQPSPEFIRAFAPTLGHIVAYMLASHEQNHLGQLQAWKRAAGITPA